MYDSLFDYKFDEALRDVDRYCDDDERDPVNRPQDEPDDWEASCLSEDAHRRMLAKASAEYHKEMEEIKRRYRNDL